MKTTKSLFLLLTLLLTPVAFSQEKTPEAPKKPDQGGFIEFGARGIWGDVYGRPDLSFKPSLRTSKYEEYRDIRDGFFIPRVRLNWDNVASKYYVDFQSDKAIYRDQSYLATLGQWNRFKLQFRFDEIPHTYSNTTRTLYTESARGVFTMPLITRTALQSIASSTSLPSTIQTQVVPGMSFFTPAILRRSGDILLAYDVNENLDLMASYRREHDTGFRPIGMIFNSSPSASLSGGYGVELPEPINYFTDVIAGLVAYTYGEKLPSLNLRPDELQLLDGAAI